MSAAHTWLGRVILAFLNRYLKLEMTPPDPVYLT